MRLDALERRCQPRGGIPTLRHHPHLLNRPNRPDCLDLPWGLDARPEDRQHTALRRAQEPRGEAGCRRGADRCEFAGVHQRRREPRVVIEHQDHAVDRRESPGPVSTEDGHDFGPALPGGAQPRGHEERNPVTRRQRPPDRHLGRARRQLPEGTGHCVDGVAHRDEGQDLGAGEDAEFHSPGTGIESPRYRSANTLR